MIIILNDNEMGISKNEPTFNFSALFNALGLEYYGIIDKIFADAKVYNQTKLTKIFLIS